MSIRTERCIWIGMCGIFLAGFIVSIVLLRMEMNIKERSAVLHAVHNANVLKALNENDMDDARNLVEVDLRGALSSLDSYVMRRGTEESRHYRLLVEKLENHHPEYYAYLTRRRNEGTQQERQQ